MESRWYRKAVSRASPVRTERRRPSSLKNEMHLECIGPSVSKSQWNKCVRGCQRLVFEFFSTGRALSCASCDGRRWPATESASVRRVVYRLTATILPAPWSLECQPATVPATPSRWWRDVIGCSLDCIAVGCKNCRADLTQTFWGNWGYPKELLVTIIIIIFIPSVVKIPRVKNKKNIKNRVGVVRS